MSQIGPGRQLVLDELWRGHADELVRYATLLVGPTDATDIIVSIAFLKVADQLGDIDNVRAYLFRTVTPTAFDQHRSTCRRQSRDLHALLPAAAPTGPDDVDVRRAVAGLRAHDIAVLPIEHRPQRRTVLPVAAAAVAAVGIGGIVATQPHDTDPEPAAQPVPTGTATATPATIATLSTAPASIAAVTGVPTFGAELPVDVAIPSSAGLVNGPAVDPPTADGQVRAALGAARRRHRDPLARRPPPGLRPRRHPWRARRVRRHLDPPPHRRLPGDGQGRAHRPCGQRDHRHHDHRGNVAERHRPGTPGCALIQVRYIDHDGNQLTVGYDVADFNTEPAFGVDLNAVIVATETVPTARLAGDIAACGPRSTTTSRPPPPRRQPRRWSPTSIPRHQAG